MNGTSDFTRRMRQAVQTGEAGDLLLMLHERIRRTRAPEIQTLLDELARITVVQVQSYMEVSTAALYRRHNDFYVVFNRRFLEESITDIDDLLHLLLHELSHKIRGDLRRLSDYEWEGKNVVADILADARLRRYLFQTPPPYLQKLYPRTGFMQILLPPEALLQRTFEEIQSMDRGLLTDAIAAHFLRTRDKRLKSVRNAWFDRLAKFYVITWLDNPSFEISVRLFTGFVSSRNPIYSDLYDTYVGTHDIENPFNEVWEMWKRSGLRRRVHNPRGGRGAGSNRRSILVHRQSARYADFLAMIRRAFEAGADKVSDASNQDLVKGIVPRIKRTEAFLMSRGYQPLFYPSDLALPNQEQGSIRIYLDVSGSFWDYLSIFYDLLLNVREFISEPVYAFSNYVAPLSFQDLAAGTIDTSGGTDFDCVAEHALKSGFKKIMIITDGYAELKIFGDELKKKCDVYAIFLNSNLYSPLIDIAGGYDAQNVKWWEWEE